jgi:tetratricopeptide (TPR) repeat protein
MHDEPGYRAACIAGMGAVLPKDPNASSAFWIAWSCVLLPNSGVDGAEVVRVAEQAVAINAKDPDYLLALGAALYRAGRFDAAAKTLVDAEAAYQREKTAPTPGIAVTTTATYSQLFLAMTHQRLDHNEEAARWLKKAVEAIDPVSPASQSSADRAWNRRLALQILHKEADALITQAAR